MSYFSCFSVLQVLRNHDTEVLGHCRGWRILWRHPGNSVFWLLARNTEASNNYNPPNPLGFQTSLEKLALGSNQIDYSNPDIPGDSDLFGYLNGPSIHSIHSIHWFIPFLRDRSLGSFGSLRFCESRTKEIPWECGMCSSASPHGSRVEVDFDSTGFDSQKPHPDGACQRCWRGGHLWRGRGDRSHSHRGCHTGPSTNGNSGTAARETT